MLALVHLGWGIDAVIKKLDREQYAALRDRVPQLNLHEWREADEKPPHAYVGDVLIDLATDGPALHRAGISFEVKAFKDTRLAAGPRSERHQHLHIAVANVSLFQVEEVELVESPTVRDLQGYLDDRWRILGVCPDPAEGGTCSFWLGRSRSAP